MYADKGVEMRVCAESRALLHHLAGATLADATEQDWYTEYLAPIISIKVVDGLDAAIAHINRYSSHHTDAILTRDHLHAQRFLREVDSSSVMVNTSTRFADGFEYGLGAEIGTSTDKFHARGPGGHRRADFAQICGAGAGRGSHLGAKPGGTSQCYVRHPLYALPALPIHTDGHTALFYTPHF